MRGLGAAIGRACSGGEVVVLNGDLGAGKTTLAQGLGRGLGIAEQVTSPTFVIARSHAHPSGGPDLVHVDAYRLGSLGEVEDLDLESDLATSVVVVEWGAGVVDGLSDRWALVTIARSPDPAVETRVVDLAWADATWARSPWAARAVPDVAGGDSP
ncbi:MAG: tRNA (adenosine(37)-N6)-threonylcarbamoyltransferase complex ATPase subunit type 1 TsaE [Actinomycetota bacterium]|nr:tRNA (adenosine(37)-N6)-threonylcarbamoyltransferase complex ATPase subunit type 1 TsaE [Actinomycetota bacterium]